jgi:ATP-binding cassette subfamily B protein
MIETLRGCVDLFVLSWRQSPVKLTVALLLKLAEASALPLSAPALGLLTDAAIAGDVRRAVVAGMAVAVLTIAALTFGHFAHIAYFELGELNLLDMNRRLADVSNGSPGLEHHERPDYADKVKVIEREMPRVSSTGMEALLSGVSLGAAIAVTAVLLSRLNPWLLLLPLAAVPPLIMGRRAEALLRDAREATAERSRRAWHLLELTADAGPAKEVRVFGLQDEIRARHATLWNQLTRKLWAAEVRAALLRILGQLVFATAYVVATLLVVRDAVAGRSSVGDVVLAVSLAALVNQQVTSAVTLLQDLQRLAQTLLGFRWLRGVVRDRTPVAPDADLPERISEGIVLHGVGFSYPGTEQVVLDGVDLVLPAGATVALVGENGAGKTSLVKLLCRFYESTHGVIELDGIDLRRVPVAAWRERIAAGFQDFVRFELLARERSVWATWRRSAPPRR